MTRKKTLCFVVIADSSPGKVNLPLESKKVTTVSVLMGSKKHKISEAHKTVKLAHDASNAQPGTAPLEASLINIEKEALDRLVKLFHTVQVTI